MVLDGHQGEALTIVWSPGEKRLASVPTATRPVGSADGTFETLEDYGERFVCWRQSEPGLAVLSGRSEITLGTRVPRGGKRWTV